MLCLTETWLKPNDYITLNESTPQDYCYKHEPRLKRKGGGVAVIYSNIFKTTKKSSFKYHSFEVLVLNVKIYSIKDIFKVLIVGDFNIHIDNEKDALGSAFKDIVNWS